MAANLTYRETSTPTVPGSTIVKGTPLTNNEVDANFKSLSTELDLKSTITYTTTYADGAAANAAVMMAIALG